MAMSLLKFATQRNTIMELPLHLKTKSIPGGIVTLRNRSFGARSRKADSEPHSRPPSPVRFADDSRQAPDLMRPAPGRAETGQTDDHAEERGRHDRNLDSHGRHPTRVSEAWRKKMSKADTR
jgi:hypothetical protein